MFKRGDLVVSDNELFVYMVLEIAQHKMEDWLVVRAMYVNDLDCSCKIFTYPASNFKLAIKQEVKERLG